ncbi:macro domain-containing protein [Methylococcaceae bacterium WWC4]|nr:macro domain-containing protein [Methylococcaceae bacterium WWC4]
MIEFVKGDFFKFDADIRINTVNCVGVMGAGVALAFKKKYPDMFKDYAKQCKAKQIKPGKPSVWHSGDLFSKGVEIVNFPTKDHWRNPSEYEYVEGGLQWLSDYLKQKNELTITLPALGCGHGGLDWNKVKSLIEKYLADSPNRILVFEPDASKNAGKQSFQANENSKILQAYKIDTISIGSDVYPNSLRAFTEKELYVFGDKPISNRYDVCVISGSKPNDIEKRIVLELINYCKSYSLSILFGGSAFDKKTAIISADYGIKTGVFLPTGILESAKKLTTINEKNLTLLSIGDPFASFDRKAYMPSVFGRIFLSNIVVFTTDRLEWIAKHRRMLKEANTSYYHIGYATFTQKDIAAIESIQSRPLPIKNEKSISEAKVVEFDVLRYLPLQPK